MKPIMLYATLVFVLAGCGTKSVPVAAALVCPDPLVLAEPNDTEKSKIQTMDAELYEYFVRRDRANTARRETLQAICRSTHSE